MADFFDDFDGPAGQSLGARAGWIVHKGSVLDQAVLTGAGALKTVNTSNIDSVAAYAVDTGSANHYAEVVLGNTDTVAGAGYAGPGAICFVGGAAAHGGVTSSFTLDYSVSYSTFYLRRNGYPVGSPASWGAPFVPGTLVRMEFKSAPDGQSAVVNVFFDGTIRLSASLPLPNGHVSFSSGTRAGVWPRCLRETELIRSFRAGALVIDTTKPTLAGVITVTSKTHNTITVQCPAGDDNVAVTAYEWSKDGGTTWIVGTRDQTFTGLTASTAYPLRARAKDAMGLVSEPALDLSVTTDAPPPPDTTKPVVSAVSVVAINASRASGSVTTNEAGTAYAMLTRTATKPADTAVRAGTGALATATASVTVGTNNGALVFTGLEPETSYFMHAIVQDASGNMSLVATSAQFAMPAGLPEGFFADSFDGTAGQTLVSRGWLPAGVMVAGQPNTGNTTFATTNGNGGVRSENTGKAGNPSAFYIDTLSTSHFSEIVVGDVIGDGGGPKSGTTTSYCWVNIPSDGTLNNAYYVDYSLAYDGFFLREFPSGGPVGSCGHKLQRGDVLRLERKAALDGQSFDMRFFINGVPRISSITKSNGLTNRGAGFRIETQVVQEDVILSASVGRLSTPPVDTVGPVLSAPSVTVKTSTSAWGHVTVDELTLTWAGITTSATKPTAAQLKAGTGFVSRHTGAADPGVNLDQFIFDDLTPSTTYYMHVSGQDMTGNVGNVVTSAPFTTQHLGVLGSVILATTGGGGAGAGFLYDKVGPGDGDKYIHYDITRQPTLGTLDAYPDGSFSYLGADDSFEYRLFKDGADQGLFTVTLGTGAQTADTTAPTLTGAIEVVARTHESLALRCPVGADNVGVIGYEWSRDAGATWTSPAGRDHTFSELAPESTHAIRVRAKDAAGNVSAPALAAAVTTDPTPVAPVRRCAIVLTTDGTAPAANLTGIRWAWWDSATPTFGTAPLLHGANATTNAAGSLEIDLPTTALGIGGVGTLLAVISDGTPNGVANRALCKPVAVI